MKLTVFNGSPRKGKSSTKILLDHFLTGFSSTDGNMYESFYLRSVREWDQQIKSFENAEYVIIGFPLYTDSMPSFVKEFIETLRPLCGRMKRLSIGYLVQSGFPEANHSRFVERYLEKLTRRLGGKYLGTIIKGNANRIDEQPKFMVKPVFKRMYNLGKIFGQTGEFNPDILSRLAKPEKLKGITLIITRWIISTRLATNYWDRHCKENGVFNKRYDQPHHRP